MSNYSLNIGTHLIIHGRQYEIVEVINTGKIKCIDINTNQAHFFETKLLLDAFISGDAAFLDRKEINSQPDLNIKLIREFSAFSDKEKATAKKRLKYVKAILDYAAEKPADRKQQLQKVAKAVGDVRPPSWVTVSKWIKSFESSSQDIRSLVPQHKKKGNRTPRLNDTQELLISEAIDHYLTPERPFITTAYKKLQKLIWKFNQNAVIPIEEPSYDTFKSRIKELDPYQVYSKRFGQRAADRKFRTYGRSHTQPGPLHETQIDHTPLDLILLDDETRIPIGRPSLTLMQDSFTKLITGFYVSFNSPSVLSIFECMKHSILPKGEINKIYPRVTSSWEAYGIPERVVIDNGNDFLSLDFEEACLDLGIEIVQCPIGQPWFKAGVERQFRTLSQSLLDPLPGKTFSNVLLKGEYDPQKDAVISFSAFIEILHIWVIDKYNNTNHRALNQSPAAKWADSIQDYPPRLPKSAAELNIKLGKIKTRKIQHYGIDMLSMRYNSDELALLRRKILNNPSVNVKYNPNDISHIFVFDPVANSYITVPCLDLPYAYKTEFQHNLIKKVATVKYKKVSHDTLMAAEEHIEQILAREFSETKKIRKQQKKARYLNVSQDTQNKLVPQPKADFNALSSMSDDLISDEYGSSSSSNNAFSDDHLDDLYDDDNAWSVKHTEKNK